jgi:hypothetical protein
MLSAFRLTSEVSLASVIAVRVMIRSEKAELKKNTAIGHWDQPLNRIKGVNLDWLYNCAQTPGETSIIP